MSLRGEILWKRQAEERRQKKINEALGSESPSEHYLDKLHDTAVDTACEMDRLINDLATARRDLEQKTAESDSLLMANENLIDEVIGLQAQLDITDRARSDGKKIIEKLVNRGREREVTASRYQLRIQEQDAEYVALAKQNEENIIKIASLEAQVLSAEKMLEWVQRNEADNCDTTEKLYRKNKKLKKRIKAIKEMTRC